MVADVVEMRNLLRMMLQLTLGLHGDSIASWWRIERERVTCGRIHWVVDSANFIC